MSDIQNIELLLGNIGDGENFRNDSGEHPFDLSQVHSQIADYPDISDEGEQNAHFLPINQRQRLNTRYNEHQDIEDQDPEISAIASDSSLSQELQPKDLTDSEDNGTEKQPQSRRYNRGKVPKVKSDKLNNTDGSTIVAGSITLTKMQEMDESQMTLDEKMERGSKKRKKGGAKLKARVTSNNPAYLAGIGG